ncbi:hypothetical protein ABLN87_15410 [Ruegeria sp. SCPT10]|uniref:hypothetical protein n=1 Tax=Ruegeria sp. SCP10 TaxID=3141377 RepID=UPI00333A0B99
MNDTTREQLSFVFAKLAGTLEDATSLVVQGQSPWQHPTETDGLVVSIEALLTHAEARLQMLKTLSRQTDTSIRGSQKTSDE